MPDLLARLPDHFARVAYNAERVPDGTHDLRYGANCQTYAYAVLAHLGVAVPPLRSSELWRDTAATYHVSSYQPLDLLLFGASADPYGAHVAIYAGDGLALHLCQAVGLPSIWTMQQFAEETRYRVLIGGKRAVQRG